MGYIIRRVNDDDKEDVVSIFNYFVENSFAAYLEKKVGCDFFETLKANNEDLPFYVIKIGNEVIGFGLLQHYHRAETFSHTATATYFILPAHTRKGLGKTLLSVLTREAKKSEISTLLVHISSMNKQSLVFHKKNGFKQCGRFRRIGRKFGEDFDVIWMEKFI